jgi:hypothetical protein
MNYLRNYIWNDVSSENDFAASLAVAKMVLQITRQDFSAKSKLSERGGEVGALILLLSTSTNSWVCHRNLAM